LDDCNTQSCLQQTTKKSWCLRGAAKHGVYSFQNLNSLFISCRSLYAQNLVKKKSENHQAAQERPQ
ncbi:unnamed protein product, partial [Brassica rapa]